MTWNTPNKRKLIRAILALKNAEEARRFLRDLLTPGEINEFAKRFETADLLTRGATYTTITKKTGFSSTTVARVAKWLNDGMGGYQSVLAKLHRPATQRRSGLL